MHVGFISGKTTKVCEGNKSVVNSDASQYIAPLLRHFGVSIYYFMMSNQREHLMQHANRLEFKLPTWEQKHRMVLVSYSCLPSQCDTPIFRNCQ